MATRFDDQETPYTREIMEKLDKELSSYILKLNSSNFTYSEFRNWVKENYEKQERFGINKTDWFSFQTHVGLSKNYKWEYLSKNKGDLTEKDKGFIKDSNKLTRAAERSVDALKVYLDSDEAPKHKYSKLRIPQSFFEVYFFYVYKEKKGIGRAALSIKDNEAILQNIREEHSKDYSGKISRSWNSKVYSANLIDSKTNKQIHFQLFSSSIENDEIILGQYLGAELFHIESGSLVLRRVFVSSLEEIPVGYFYHDHNRDEYAKIPDEIVRFLQLKWLNYHKTPNTVFNMETLLQHTENYKETWGTRSLVPKKLQVFFALPNSAVTSDEEFAKTRPQINSIINNIKNKFADKADFNKIISREKSLKNRHIIPPSLSGLTRCNLFIWFYMGSDQASFSAIQTGISLSYCQQAIIIHKLHSLSKGIQRLRNLQHIDFITVDGELSKDMSDHIEERISESIDFFLEN